jgi:anthranilate synthase component 2
VSEVLLIDCYDSFSYTIVNYLETLGAVVTVMKSDDVALLAPGLEKFSHFVLSPGPGHPQEYPILLAVIRRYWMSRPMLGICLGHQAIAHTCGGRVIPAPLVKHGKTSKIQHDNQGLLIGFKQNFLVMRYHSLVVDENTCPQELIIDAWTYDQDIKLIMGFHHEIYPVFGVQYHPESILSEFGRELFACFLQIN